MKKKLSFSGIDCANCAAKIEAKIAKIPGVQSVNLSFMTERMVLEADEAEMPRILQEAEKLARTVESGAKFI